MNLETLKFRCDVVGECWEFRTDAKTPIRRRHPMAQVNGYPTLLRRHAYELVRGPIEEGYLAPFCENPCCINPAHQKVMTKKQASTRGGKAAAHSPTRSANVAKARRERGQTKITMEIANIIRGSEAAAHEEALKYGIDQANITAIRRGKVWKDYANPFTGLGART